jgi:hypothetical protein
MDLKEKVAKLPSILHRGPASGRCRTKSYNLKPSPTPDFNVFAGFAEPTARTFGTPNAILYRRV